MWNCLALHWTYRCSSIIPFSIYTCVERYAPWMHSFLRLVSLEATRTNSNVRSNDFLGNQFAGHVFYPTLTFIKGSLILRVCKVQVCHWMGVAHQSLPIKWDDARLPNVISSSNNGDTALFWVSLIETWDGACYSSSSLSHKLYCTRVSRSSPI